MSIWRPLSGIFDGHRDDDYIRCNDDVRSNDYDSFYIYVQNLSHILKQGIDGHAMFYLQLLDSITHAKKFLPHLHVIIFYSLTIVI